jgi:hypothetical protein
MLASGSVEITTTGNVQANNIVIASPLTWASGSELALDSYDSVKVETVVSVTGVGALSISTNDSGGNGALWFSPKGNVAFSGTSNTVLINGASYTLVSSLHDLADSIAENPSGSYALSDGYDAAQDGVYNEAPVATTFEGSFNGLGNVVSNLSIKGNADTGQFGLFATLDTPAVVSSLTLSRVTLETTGGHPGFGVGGLAGINNGLLFNSSVTGKIKVRTKNEVGYFGGVVGTNGGTIDQVASKVTVHVSKQGHDSGFTGGLVGLNGGLVEQSYAIGSSMVSGSSGAESVGSLLGGNTNLVVDCYSTGAVSEHGAGDAAVGGLVGYDIYGIQSSYSTGKPIAGSNSFVGGLIGIDANSTEGNTANTYWDITTSEILKDQGAGNVIDDPGIKGKTTSQLRGKLPEGFDAAVWAQGKKINNGLPYLISNPPR